MQRDHIQNLIAQIAVSTGRNIGFLDDSPKVIFSNGTHPEGDFSRHVLTDMATDRRRFMHEGYSAEKTVKNSLILVEGTDEIAAKLCTVLAIMLADYSHFREDKYGKNNFMKELIVNPELNPDFQMMARMWSLELGAEYIAMVIHAKSGLNASVSKMLRGVFPDTDQDIIFELNEADSVLVKCLKGDGDCAASDLMLLKSALTDDHEVDVIIGVGTPVTGLENLPQSYREAVIALKIGAVFDAEQKVFRYDNLGIARLLYQLPADVCETFLSEVFRGEPFETLEPWVLATIRMFLANDCNVSEASRRLFIHRNTLIYRLNKIQTTTGLDLRKFDHAAKFKLALMVIDYLNANPGEPQSGSG